MAYSDGKPRYDLNVVKRLVEEGEYSSTNRVRTWLDNHGYVDFEVIAGVVESMTIGDFIGSCALSKKNGTIADEYIVRFDDDKWYVKLFIDEDTGLLRVRIWSCCWDGAVH